MPRITGRPTEGPNELLLTPGMLFNVSANVFSRLNESSRPLRIEMGTTISSEPTPKGFPVTGVVGSIINDFSAATAHETDNSKNNSDIFLSFISNYSSKINSESPYQNKGIYLN
jgi:hypothetical protein